MNNTQAEMFIWICAAASLAGVVINLIEVLRRQQCRGWFAFFLVTLVVSLWILAKGYGLL
jgi:hypothetical protein